MASALALSARRIRVRPDALVAWVAQSDARAYATDRFIFNKTTEGIALDDKQDWHVLGGSQTTNQSTGDTWTTVHVWRQLDTGDCNDRPIVPGKLHNIIWAMGPTTDVSYHSSDRGSSALVLASAPGPSIIAPAPPPSPSASASASAASDSLEAVGRLAAQQQAGKQPAQQAQQQQESMLNFTFTNYRLPTDFTTYRCKVVDVALKTKTHAVEWGAVLNSTDISAVHHAIIYGCKPKEYGNLKGAGATFDCLHDTPCATTVAVWAVGGRPFTFPPNVGYPIGSGYFTKFVLQVHFTNPKGRADLIDNSGIYLKLAPSLRSMDASIMLTGPVPYEYLIRIPPAMPSWTQVSTCPGECTAKVFGNESVKIIGSFLHLHTLGRQLYTDVFRKGSKVATISRQDYYDFASQQTIPFTPEFELLPGDELRTSCVWDSSDRTNVRASPSPPHHNMHASYPTFGSVGVGIDYPVLSPCWDQVYQHAVTVGGPSTEEEMCIDYLIYYPARQGQEKDSCYDLCASYENDTLGMDPTSPIDGLVLRLVCIVRERHAWHGPHQPYCLHSPRPLPPPPSPSFTSLPPEMDACYDFCASYDNDTLGLNPNSPTLSKFYVCGPNFIPTYQPCKITFGSNTPKKVVNGCPADPARLYSAPTHRSQSSHTSALPFFPFLTSSLPPAPFFPFPPPLSFPSPHPFLSLPPTPFLPFPPPLSFPSTNLSSSTSHTPPLYPPTHLLTGIPSDTAPAPLQPAVPPLATALPRRTPHLVVSLVSHLPPLLPDYSLPCIHRSHASLADIFSHTISAPLSANAPSDIKPLPPLPVNPWQEPCIAGRHPL
ncbi:unnamed protein product [Closterium sp. NIES-64]|nr:unnamed protein product [Closterium sp. NIES-64]